MKYISKLLFAVTLLFALATTISCEKNKKDVEEYEVTEETVTTKEELTTTATDTSVVK